MRPLHRFHRTRRIASALLFVWPLATAVSWAGPCCRQPCAIVCETEQSVVAKAKTVKADGNADAGMPLVGGREAWPAFTPGRIAPRWRPLAAPPPPGPPVSIVFLRLTR